MKNILTALILLSSCTIPYNKVGMVQKTDGADTIKGKYLVYVINHKNQARSFYTDSCYKKFSLIKKKDLK